MKNVSTSSLPESIPKKIRRKNFIHVALLNVIYPITQLHRKQN